MVEKWNQNIGINLKFWREMNQTTVDTEKLWNQNTREKGNQKKMKSECSIEMKSGENEIRMQHKKMVSVYMRDIKSK